jgi:hypothetical protein
MSPEEIVDIVDFRYLTDAITRDEALEILRRAEPGKAERIARLEETATPATPRPQAGSATPTTSCGGCAARRSPPATITSSSRSAAILRTISGG